MKIPVLLYHTISDPSTARKYPGISVPPENFRRQMKTLHRNGFRTVDTETVYRYISGKNIRMPEHPVMITFDDGYRDNLELALPVMEQCGFHCVIYVVGNAVGKDNYWDVELGETSRAIMDEKDIRECISRGHEIGGHTANHTHLAQIGPDKAAEEIRKGNRRLEEITGKTIINFAYPYGEYDDNAVEVLKTTGVKCAFTTEFGTNIPGDDTMLLKRIPVRSNTHLLKFMIRMTRFSEKGIVWP